MKLSLLIIPLTALLIVVFLYWFNVRKTASKSGFKKLSWVVAIIAFLLNLAWELLQIPLYQAIQYDLIGIGACAAASVADAIMVLLLFLGFALIFHDQFWITKLNLFRIFLLVLVGGVCAVLAEMRHLSMGSWEYSENMPTLPVVGAGLSPVLQFMILPALTFFLSTVWFNNIKKT